MPTARDATLRTLTTWLGLAVVLELVLLRTGTRTLIHIPGLGRFEVPIGVLNEVGRFAFYLSLVLVVATLAYVGWSCWTRRTVPGRLVGGFVWAFLAVAGLGRFGMVSDSVVAWFALFTMVGALVVTWNGVRSIPIALLVTASAIATWSVLGQGTGGGLSGRAVDFSTVTAEALFILAGVTAPLLVTGRVTKSGLIAGLVVVVVMSAGFSVGGSTLAILTLWNLGVPGWFAPIAYGFALGGLVITLWSAISDRMATTTCGVVLMIAGGVGPISTYQTALALTAVILLGIAEHESPVGSVSPVGDTASPDKELVAMS